MVRGRRRLKFLLIGIPVSLLSAHFPFSSGLEGQRSLYYLSRPIVEAEYLVAFSWHNLRSPSGPVSRLSGPVGYEPMKSPNMLVPSSNERSVFGVVPNNFRIFLVESSNTRTTLRLRA
jgi:hypothetical protein